MHFSLYIFCSFIENMFAVNNCTRLKSTKLWANWVPKQENISIQKLPMKIVSLPLTIILGFPCSLWIVSMNVVATIVYLKGWKREKKWV